jgi:hypothetical protein
MTPLRCRCPLHPLRPLRPLHSLRPLQVSKVATFESSTFPYQGRYPCGQLAYKGSWW